MQFRFDQTRVRVNVAEAPTLHALVRARLQRRRGFALATINLDHLVKLQASAEFREAYAAHDVVVADGNPIVWLSRLAGLPVSLVPGSDLVIPLARIAQEAGVSVALVGSTRNALDAAAERMRRAVPGLSIVSCTAPPFGFDPTGAEAAAILADLKAQGAGLCLIALGAPKQEIFVALGRRIAPQVGFASVGAGLDFLAGQQSRAPAWMRALAMEWAWRALSDPRRLMPRYAACAAILPGQVVAALRMRLR